MEYSSVECSEDVAVVVAQGSVIYWSVYNLVVVVVENVIKPLRFAYFWEGHNPLRLPRETTFEASKMAQAWSVLYILTWKCTSHYNDVSFFDI